MTFQEALKTLDIEDYGERIVMSNSHGELFHLEQYIGIAEIFKDDVSLKAFRPWFVELIKEVNKTWERPSSVYQHIITILIG